MPCAVVGVQAGDQARRPDRRRRVVASDRGRPRRRCGRRRRAGRRRGRSRSRSRRTPRPVPRRSGRPSDRSSTSRAGDGWSAWRSRSGCAWRRSAGRRPRRSAVAVVTGRPVLVPHDLDRPTDGRRLRPGQLRLPKSGVGSGPPTRSRTLSAHARTRASRLCGVRLDIKPPFAPRAFGGPAPRSAAQGLTIPRIRGAQYQRPVWRSPCDLNGERVDAGRPLAGTHIGDVHKGDSYRVSPAYAERKAAHIRAHGGVPAPGDARDLGRAVPVASELVRKVATAGGTTRRRPSGAARRRRGTGAPRHPRRLRTRRPPRRGGRDALANAVSPLRAALGRSSPDRHSRPRSRVVGGERRAVAVDAPSGRARNADPARVPTAPSRGRLSMRRAGGDPWRVGDPQAGTVPGYANPGPRPPRP